jgi:hypothetical protein
VILGILEPYFFKVWLKAFYRNAFKKLKIVNYENLTGVYNVTSAETFYGFLKMYKN